MALPIAAPSCVLPATVAENATFLAHRVEEVGLCFFETKACLEYTREDLPLELAALPLRYHVHLPVDLPWHKGGAVAAGKALALLEKIVFLKPRYAVLHPPKASSERQEVLLRAFAKVWFAASRVGVLLENLDHAPLFDLPPDLFVEQEKKTKNKKCIFGLCLDVGHMLSFGHEEILHYPYILKAAKLLHWSAPGMRDEHLPLSSLTEEQCIKIRAIVPLLPRQTTHMLEIFHWDGIKSSWPILHNFLEA